MGSTPFTVQLPSAPSQPSTARPPTVPGAPVAPLPPSEPRDPFPARIEQFLISTLVEFLISMPIELMPGPVAIGTGALPGNTSKRSKTVRALSPFARTATPVALVIVVVLNALRAQPDCA